MSTDFPINEILPEVLAALETSSTVILQAPPGAGKSTVLPLHLLKAAWLGTQKILMLEPRRLAARGVAARLASQLGENVGETIGYRVRFENQVSAATQLEVLTEGILTRRLQHDTSLDGVGLVVFDEFHERSLHADLALALCREAQQILRPDLRILIMSATLDAAPLSALLDNAPVLTSEGRQYPVAVHYRAPDTDARLHDAVAEAVRNAAREFDGDLLVFLPGAGEIHRTQEILERTMPALAVHPLYGDLPVREQQAALQPNASGKRKVVLATSIAETSLTIEGIGIVIDSGYARVPKFDARTGLTRLETVRVTVDAADQRAGRAGRLGPGVAIRLWSETVQRGLTKQRVPEVLEADLAPLMLELAQWGVRKVTDLSWLAVPPAAAVNQATELLRQLDALDEESKITERGRAMLRLPAHPRIAHLLLESVPQKQEALAADVAALLEERDPMQRGESAGADLVLRVEALRRWRNRFNDSNESKLQRLERSRENYSVERKLDCQFERSRELKVERSRLERIEKLALAWRKQLNAKIDNALPGHTAVGLLLSAAYPERIAKRLEQNGRYRLANGRTARLQQNDPLGDEEWLAVAHLDGGSNEGKIHLAAPLDPADVMHAAKPRRTVSWDAQKGELIARTEMRIGEMIAASTPLKDIPDDERLKILLNVVRSEGHTLFNWNEVIEQWQARVLSLRIWRINEDWPDVSTELLLQNADEWLAPWLGNVRRRDDFKRIEILPLLQTLLPWEQQQQLEKLAPEKLNVPSGSQIKLNYSTDGSAPVLAVRLQELFGLPETPSVNEGRNRVMIHLLSPAYRPVQVTQDLHSFWENTYQEVRKELRIRYPKHHWPEDPWTAEAVRGAKRKNNPGS
jgi:ATP-dependent helicase HrpB